MSGRDEEVVIAGIGCRFPDADSIEELADKIYAGENLIMGERGPSEDFVAHLPEHSGKVRNFRKFDNTFFGISNIVVRSMDPMTRHILERSFEAVIDAGMNPADIKGTNTAVFSGTTMSDYDLEWVCDYKGGYGIMGRNRCMNANRVSYWLDLNGHSVSLDSTWANGIANIQCAVEAIRKGQCDTALVSAASLLSHSEITIQMNDLGVLSPDGVCRSYDEDAAGYSRCDAVVVMVLQRASIAKRCYATIQHVKATCFGDREDHLTRTSQTQWEDLLFNFYNEAKVDVNEICYLEGHGAGVKEEDANELNAVRNVLCTKRSTPLNLGCIKGNMGHTESASALCGIIKAILGLERGIVPANISFNKPNQKCEGLLEGSIKVLVENTPLPKGQFAAVNVHGFGGVYGHILLKANPKEKNVEYDGLPRLVLLADRTEEFLPSLIKKVESMAYDDEFISLLNEVHSKKLDKYLSRGYTILPKINNVTINECQKFVGEKRPVWFIFSGMGSQWPQMAKKLMELPLFRASIEKCHEILKSKGLDLIRIVTMDDAKMFDNILHSFVGIAAVQIALVDILHALGIVPDGMVGHSVGELGCAYADGCFTAEQMILSAYSRGMASLESDLIRGFMAAVGKGYEQMKDVLPEGIEVACHNSADSCTISGPAELVKEYVAKLQSEGVFARTVNVSNIAYHSRYIKPAAPRLLKYLKEVIPNPKPRSKKWISTSNLEVNWDSELARFCSAEYHTNNLLSSVLFEEGSKHIPKNAICIEIAPHGLLQAILKRSLDEHCVHIPLTRRSTEEPLNYLLQAIGKMYITGLHPQVANLYPKVQYPVSRNTPSLHQLVHWQYEHDVQLTNFRASKKVIYSIRNELLKLSQEGVGYIVGDKNIYPVSIFLHLVWEIYAYFQRRRVDNCPVTFENVRLLQPFIVVESDPHDVMVLIQNGGGLFEVTCGQEVLVTGMISGLREMPAKVEPATGAVKSRLSHEDVYLEFRHRGHEFAKSLQLIDNAYILPNGWRAEVSSSASFVSTMEALTQLFLLQAGERSRSLLLPLSLQCMTLLPLYHAKVVTDLPPGQTIAGLELNYNAMLNIARCGGIEIRGLKTQEISNIRASLTFESNIFLSLMNPTVKDVRMFLDFCGDVINNNRDLAKDETTCEPFRILEITKDNLPTYLGQYFQSVFSRGQLETTSALGDSAVAPDVVICSDAAMTDALRDVARDGFVLVKSELDEFPDLPQGVAVVTHFISSKNELAEYRLLRKITSDYSSAEFIQIPSYEAILLNILNSRSSSKGKLYLTTNTLPPEGVEGFTKRIQAETLLDLKWLFILDSEAPAFSPEHPFYKSQIQKGLKTNVYKEGNWGMYHSRLFTDVSTEENSNVNRLSGTHEVLIDYVAVDETLDFNVLQNCLFEYSGKLARCKTAIMGITSGLNKMKIVPDASLTWNLPSSWSSEDGATIPLSYTLAYYSLVVLGDLKSFESVLVTDAWSSNGLAAVAVALSLCKRVYATVANIEEALLLRKRYPMIHEDDILLHSDKNFDIELGLLTFSDFPEVTYNALEGVRLMSAVNCLPNYGRFFHLGKEDYINNVQLGTAIFLGSTTFYSVFPEKMNELAPETKQRIHDLIDEGINNGTVRPLPRTILSHKGLVEAKKCVNFTTRSKYLLGIQSLKKEMNKLRIQPDCSYLIFGDESEVWLDIAEWLMQRGVRSIVISKPASMKTQRVARRMALLQNQRDSGLIIYEGATTKRAKELMNEVNRLDPLAAVFFVAMTSDEVSVSLSDVDKQWRDPNGHLVVLSQTDGAMSRLCTTRYSQGFPATHFVWDADQALVNLYLNVVEKLSGQEPVITVSPNSKRKLLAQSTGHLLLNVLPSTLEELSALGASLSPRAVLVPLSTLGQPVSRAKELSPIIFIPGLQGDPLEVVRSLAKRLMYPAFCVKLPHRDSTSIEELANAILPEIKAVKKGRSVNLVGVCWGSTVALETARLLEAEGYRVCLILIDGPLLTLRDALLASGSYESDLLNLIAGHRQLEGDEQCWETRLQRAVTSLNLPSQQQTLVAEALGYVRHSLKALVEFEPSTLRLAGPLNILQSEMNGTSTYTTKLCHFTTHREFPMNFHDMMDSVELSNVINMAAITDAMSDKSVHSCSWRELEEFLVQERLCDRLANPECLI